MTDQEDPIPAEEVDRRVRLAQIVRGESPAPTAQFQRDKALAELLDSMTDANGGLHMKNSEPWAFAYEMSYRSDTLYMDADCASAFRPDGGSWTPVMTEEDERKRLTKSVEWAESQAAARIQKAKRSLAAFEVTARLREDQT